MISVSNNFLQSSLKLNFTIWKFQFIYEVQPHYLARFNFRVDILEVVCHVSEPVILLIQLTVQMCYVSLQLQVLNIEIIQVPYWSFNNITLK